MPFGTHADLDKKVSIGFKVKNSYSPAGARVIDITPGLPADLAGLLVDDIILNVNGKPIKNAPELRTVGVNAFKPGTVATISIRRGDGNHRLMVKIKKQCRSVMTKKMRKRKIS